MAYIYLPYGKDDYNMLFICGNDTIKNITKDDFVNNKYVSEETYDANKNWDGDSGLCWAAATSDIIAYTGWNNYIENFQDNTTKDIESKIFNIFKNSFTNHGSVARNALTWFFINYYYQLFPSWAAKLKDGGFLSKYFNENTINNIAAFESACEKPESTYIYNNDDFGSNALNKLINIMKYGVGISIQIGWYNDDFTDRTNAHEMACFGFAFDKNGKVNGIIAADPDSDINTIKIYPIKYNSDKNFYEIEIESFLFIKNIAILDNITFLAPKGLSWNNSELLSDIDFNIEDNFIAKNIQLNNNDIINVKDKGTIDYCIAYNKSIQHIYSGGIASSVFMYNNSIQNIYSGGKAHNIYANNSSHIDIQSGGYVKHIEAKNSATIHFSTFSAKAENISLSDNAKLDYDTWTEFTLNGGRIDNVDYHDGTMYVDNYGYASNFTIHSFGWQHISNGGLTYNANVLKGGYQRIYDKGKAYNTIVENGGSQFVYSGGLAVSTTVCNGGSHYIYSGGSSIDTIVKDGSIITVENGGFIKKICVEQDGVTRINDWCDISNITINNGGRIDFDGYNCACKNLTINSGGTLSFLNTINYRVKSNGILKNITYSSAHMYITTNMLASNFIVESNAIQYVTGATHNATVTSCSQQIVSHGGKSNNTIVKSGSIISAIDATLKNTSVTKNSAIVAQGKSIISSLSLESNSSLYIENSVKLVGKFKISDASILADNADTKNIKFTAGSNIELKKNSKFEDLTINCSNINITISNINNSFHKIILNSKSEILYNISNLNQTSKALLNIKSSYKNSNAKYFINISNNQKEGIYNLSNNLIQEDKVRYTLNQANKKIGYLLLNSTGSIIKSKMYNILKNGKSINLYIYSTGKFFKGNDKNNNLTGSNKADIFYGGKGNDIINSLGARNVVVYDSNNWGKDLIKKTNGTITILFNEINKKNITTKKSGTKMIISNKKDKLQSIVIENWQDSTHNILYASNMNSLKKFLKTSNPNSTITNNAIKEVWKKTGLGTYSGK